MSKKIAERFLLVDIGELAAQRKGFETGIQIRNVAKAIGATLPPLQETIIKVSSSLNARLVLTDAVLLNLYKTTGELAHLGELFSRYKILVYGVCVKYLKDRDEAKDATMQVFEKLIQSLHQHEVENFKSWLYVTTRNHCLMQLRAKKGKYMEEFSAERMENQLLLHPEHEPELENNLTKLERCIATLATEQQQCVRLFYLDERCYKEVAETTGFSLNQVKSYIQNGKRNLKLCMEQND
ncbi:MAG: sigma-70 family RNA polymerase sigma factor [Cytophagales bacterium]|nr:sigma-70 family RNA polymerase sigma factor [Cytophagales bacterium]